MDIFQIVWTFFESAAGRRGAALARLSIVSSFRPLAHFIPVLGLPHLKKRSRLFCFVIGHYFYESLYNFDTAACAIMDMMDCAVLPHVFVSVTKYTKGGDATCPKSSL